jgi:Pyridoxamine 5'-phosphate oxidase
VAAWYELRSARPELAGAGRDLLYQHGVGYGFLATVRPDGGPRLHPIWPLLTEDELFAFIIPSPKQADLRRDGRYALHSFPCEDNEDGFSVSGYARLEEDPSMRRALAAQFVRERETLGVPTPDPDDALFRFEIGACLLTRSTGHGDFVPVHEVWRP